MIDDIILNKKESIEQCSKQIAQYYGFKSLLPFAEDYYKQDAIAINIQRIADLSIDLANHVIKKRKLGIPKESKESFDILEKNHIIPADLCKRLKAMVGFRNILVHTYQKLDIKIMIDVIENRLNDSLQLTDHIIGFSD